MFAAPAFAASPFADAPAGHWAYDALARLAADSLVAGYPDGVFKGARPAAIYEVASVVARALARLDADKAGKSDLEMLKKLAAEFRDELEALGVKTDSLEKRTALLEDRLGGWRLRGTFMFYANFGADADKAFYNRRRDGSSAGMDFNKNWFTLVLTKQIDATTSFYARFRSASIFLALAAATSATKNRSGTEFMWMLNCRATSTTASAALSKITKPLRTSCGPTTMRPLLALCAWTVFTSTKAGAAFRRPPRLAATPTKRI